MSDLNRFNFTNSNSELDYVGKLADYMCAEFEGKIKNFEYKHNLTRRFNIVFSVLTLIGFMYLLSGIELLSATKLNDIGEIQLINDEYYSNTLIGVLFFCFVYCVILFLAFGVGRFNETKNNTFLNLKSTFWRVLLHCVVAVSISCVLLFEWEEVFPMFFAVGVVGFVCSYSVNSKLGYTKAWSRNRLARQKVQIIYGQYIEGFMHEEIAVDQLFKIYESAKEQAHQDIVKDYENYGTAALGWIKGLKK